MSEDFTQYKKQAAEFAVDKYVKSGMVLGLGHGSTAIWALRRIAHKLESGELKDIVGIPASNKVEQEAQELSIPLTTLNDQPRVAVTIDGADEFDQNCNLIKGGGGALLREKILAQASDAEVIIADHHKFSPVIGTTWAVPIEVAQFGYQSHFAYLKTLGGSGELRMQQSQPYQTDGGNFIIDWRFGPVQNPHELSNKLIMRPGILEHGMFIDLATEIIYASPDGIHHLTPHSIG